MISRLLGCGVVAASMLALVGCAGTGGNSSDDDPIAVVASTSVYGQIAEEVGDDAVAVTSLISSAAQDPHAYEASARDQLTVSRADLIIENGGGYDPFVDALIEASGTDAPVLTAVQFSPEWTGTTGQDAVAGFNEHVWYDLAAMRALADAIAGQLGELRPAQAAAFSAAAAAFGDRLDPVDAALADIADGSAGARIFVTEPVPLYLTAAAGLVNATPPAFSEAVEEGQDVPPATLLASLGLLADGSVSVVIVNAQTGGAETTQVVDAAATAGIPVLDFTETLPDGDTYVEWMQRNADQLAEALAA